MRTKVNPFQVSAKVQGLAVNVAYSQQVQSKVEHTEELLRRRERWQPQVPHAFARV